MNFINKLEDDPRIIKSIESICPYEVQEIIFNSTTDDWSIDTSVFGKKLKGKSNVCIVIEDDRNNIFGGVITKKIGINHFHHDKNSFVFSIKRDRKIEPAQFMIKEECFSTDFFICNEGFEVLFGFGLENDPNRFGRTFSDICVCKNGSSNHSYCEQKCFNYGDKQNALCGRYTFTAKKIVVFQLKEKKENRMKREQEIMLTRVKDEIEIKYGIEAMANLEIADVLFDSDVDNYARGTSTFAGALEGRENVCIVVQDGLKNIFGGYLKNQVSVRRWQNDSECFLFGIKKNGEYINKKYTQENNGVEKCDFMVFGDDERALFMFGKGSANGKTTSDLFVYKSDVDYECFTGETGVFNYNGESLNDKQMFIPERILVFELREKEIEEKQERPKIDFEKYLENLTQMKIDEILFDSNIHNWSVDNSDFGRNIEGHSNVAIVIEDENNNIFGGFYTKETRLQKYHFDRNCIVFSLKKYNQYNPLKYQIKSNNHDFFVCGDNHQILFAFGAEEKQNKQGQSFRDICVLKNGAEGQNYCEQYSFEYHGKQNALCGRRNFNIKRLYAFAMKDKDENKKKKDEEIAIAQVKDDFETKMRLEKMTGMNIGDVLFDSDFNAWNINDSEFCEAVKGRTNVAIVIEDEDNNIFGGFTTEKIKLNKFHHDKNCFVFSVKKDGKYQSAKYTIKPSEYDYKFCKDEVDVLFAFGAQEKADKSRSFTDICVQKCDSQRNSYCEQYSFDYMGKEYALCGKPMFVPMHIIVYQMEESDEEKQRREEEEMIMKKKQDETEIPKAIEEISGLKIQNKIFDSEVDNWAKGTSSFAAKIMNKNKILILIEDKKNNIFGGFISTHVMVNCFCSDNQSYLFSLKKNGKYHTRKFEYIQNPVDPNDVTDLFVYDDQHQILFSFGKSIVDNNCDIIVFKNGLDKLAICEQNSYQYNGKDNALCGKNEFEVSKITVYQMA